MDCRTECGFRAQRLGKVVGIGRPRVRIQRDEDHFRTKRFEGSKRTNHAVVFQIRGHHSDWFSAEEFGHGQASDGQIQRIGAIQREQHSLVASGRVAQPPKTRPKAIQDRLALHSPDITTPTWRGSDFGQMPGDGFGNPGRFGVAGGRIVQMDWWTFHSGSLRLEVGGDGGDAVAGPGQNVLVGQKDDAEVFGSLLLTKT